MDDCPPLLQDLDSVRSIQELAPPLQQHEGLNIINREDFRDWVSMTSSGLLWIDGYELPGRRSWIADFTIGLVHASLLSGYETLYSFNSPHSSGSVNALSLIQRFSSHLLEKYPGIWDHGDPDLLSGEILLAAKTDFSLSWRIFLECLGAVDANTVYIIIEAVDALGSDRSKDGLFGQFLAKLSGLTSTGAVGGKTVKLILTSTGPNPGFDLIFSTRRNAGQLEDPRHLLLRISPAAARSRKQRSTLRKNKRTRFHTRSSSTGVGFRTYQSQTVLGLEDFAPDEEDLGDHERGQHREGGQNVTSPTSSESDFDIFSDETSSKATRKREDGDRTLVRNNSATGSESSLDIFQA